MSMTIDDFTDNCVARAEKGVASNGVRFSFVPFLIPLIQTAIEFLMNRLGKCGQSDEEIVQAIRTRSFAARYTLNQAVHLAERQTGSRPGAGAYVKNIILDEAEATKDDDLKSMRHEPDSYVFDATDVWGVSSPGSVGTFKETPTTNEA